jgi:hypothetical protein
MTNQQRERLEQIRYDIDNGVTTYLCDEAIDNLYDELNYLESLEKDEPLVYRWKFLCEKRIEEIKRELQGLESYPKTEETLKQIEDLEYELCDEYASLEDYKGRIRNYECGYGY